MGDAVDAEGLARVLDEGGDVLAATSDGPEPWSRKSHQAMASASAGFDALPSAPIVPLTI